MDATAMMAKTANNIVWPQNGICWSSDYIMCVCVCVLCLSVVRARDYIQEILLLQNMHISVGSQRANACNSTEKLNKWKWCALH